ncbi:hypothetical protein CANARDRAFT_23892 [[Candida] arabinofermentans NRRL YB-2248]|uniref:Uncharacterized protein n=1 Tax=[Candida] arabinofermentans NRRL YB-2248 TaxID=983967 RepID=A0A1E4SYB6_9ASCO|nr:hypothetical protein CANARDRAFT_23892 [[Candida] arabinofermentans NRRL YB-2248]
MLAGARCSCGCIGVPVKFTRTLVNLSSVKSRAKSPKPQPLIKPEFDGDYRKYEQPVLRPTVDQKIVDNDAIISKVFGQLNIKRDVVELKKYIEIPIFTPKEDVPLPPIIPRRPFKFDPKDYQVTKKELEQKPKYWPDSKILPIISDTPMVSSYKDLKGVNKELYMLGAQFGILKNKQIHRSEFFALQFFPKEHFISKIRKSRPGIMQMTSNQHMLNTLNVKPIKSNYSNVNFYPFKLAVHRSQYMKLVRKTFFNIFINDSQLIAERDGLYKFQLERYPVTSEEITKFKLELQLALNKVKRMDSKKLKRDAESDNKRIPWKAVWQHCDKFNIPRIEK